jgi:hypothetical protein
MMKPRRCRARSGRAYAKVPVALLWLLLLCHFTEALAPISRRKVFSDACKNSCFVVAALVQGPDVVTAAPVVQDTLETTRRPVVSLLTGVQYSDLRVGQGESIQKDDIVILHLRAMLRDGSIIFDTQEDEDGSPLMHKIGSVQDYNFFGGDGSKRSKVTLGVEDAILSRGSSQPMTTGGIRLVVVPGPLAYGTAGVSGYNALQMKFRQGVPRDALIRYEVEILRCLDVKVSDGNLTRTVCCTEPNFPCKTGE